MSLKESVEIGKLMGPVALYFGAKDRPGHYLHAPKYMSETEIRREYNDLPWSLGLMDGGLLKNGKHPDQPDGRVWWTCGGAGAFWYAFYWWDRSCDSRGACNSGFYVRGFGWPETKMAFDYACSVWTKIVARQLHPLVLQEPK